MEEIINEWADSSGAASEPKPENPAAFPLVVGTPADPWGMQNDGMTLRDYFAAKAMAAIIANIVVAKNADGEYMRNVDDVAKLAFKQADALLKARAT